MKKILTAIALVGVLTLAGCNFESGSSSTSLSSSSVSVEKSNTAKNYVGNKNNGKLHSIHCGSLPYEQNRIYFESIEEANSAGYTDQHKECINR